MLTPLVSVSNINVIFKDKANQITHWVKSTVYSNTTRTVYSKKVS